MRFIGNDCDRTSRIPIPKVITTKNSRLHQFQNSCPPPLTKRVSVSGQELEWTVLRK